MIITQRALAAELGVDESRISQYARRGMPRVPGGVDRDVALEWIRTNILPQGGRNSHRGAAHVHAMRRGNGPPDREAPRDREPELDPPQERARRDRAATKKLELENGVREGQLIPADEVARTWQRVAGLVRSSLLNMPSKLAARLASKPAAEVQGIIALEVSDILETLAASCFTDLARRSSHGRRVTVRSPHGHPQTKGRLKWNPYHS